MTMMTKTIRHGEPLTFTGSFGCAQVERKNGLWRVVFDGKNDWYAHLDQACSVAISLSERGVPPASVESLLSKANRRAQ